MTTLDLVLYSEVFGLRVPGWIKIVLPYSQLSNMSISSFFGAFGLRVEKSIDRSTQGALLTRSYKGMTKLQLTLSTVHKLLIYIV